MHTNSHKYSQVQTFSRQYVQYIPYMLMHTNIDHSIPYIPYIPIHTNTIHANAHLYTYKSISTNTCTYQVSVHINTYKYMQYDHVYVIHTTHANIHQYTSVYTSTHKNSQVPTIIWTILINMYNMFHYMLMSTNTDHYIPYILRHSYTWKICQYT